MNTDQEDIGISLEKEIEIHASRLVELLIRKKLHIRVAESCTGGLLSAAIVGVSGCSEVFDEGLVTYANLSKMDRLDVKKSTLDMYGAVSSNVAKEMTEGLLSKGADIAISTTGVAGPGGGTVDKPVGLVYIAVATESDVKVTKNIFFGTRNEIRCQSVLVALKKAIEILN